MTPTTTPTLLAGVDQVGTRYRVRKMFPAPFNRVIEYHDRPDEANARALDLDRRRKAGLSPSDAQGDPPLSEAATGLLAAKKVSGRRRPLSKRGVAFWERSLKPWIDGPFADVPLSLLSRAKLEDALLARQAIAPTSARNERQALIAALERAVDRGARIDLAILRLPPIALNPRARVALAAAELEWFARHTPDHGRRLVLAQGTIGNRIEELFKSEPAHLDLDSEQPTMFVPAGNCKERVDKLVPLTGEEVALMREQLGGLHAIDPSSLTSSCPASPPGAPRLFMTPGYRVYPTGKIHRTAAGPKPWAHSTFDKLVWQPAVRAAADAWRIEHELADVVVAGRLVPAPTPFEWWIDPADVAADGRRRDDDGRRWITSHDLRATAVTMMRDLDISRDIAAARVGHGDRGELVDAIYDKGSRAARVGRALTAAAPDGLRAALGANG